VGGRTGGHPRAAAAAPGPRLFARLPAILVLILIPWTVVCATVLHSLLSAVVLAGLLALTAAALFCTGTLRPRRVHLWIAVMAAVVLAGYLFPAVRLESHRQTLENFIWLLAGFVVLAVCAAAPPRSRALAGLIASTGAAAALVSSAQGQLLEGRLQGLQLNPNYLAVYLAPSIVIALGLALRSQNPLWLLPGAACVPALLASQSREGVLATVAGAAFMLLQGRPRHQKVLIVLAVAIAVAIFPGDLGTLATLGAGPRTAAELSTDDLVRIQVALFAGHAAISHPLAGIGVGQFPAYAAVASSLGVYITTTNEYLLLAAETGLICLGAFVVLLSRAISRSRHGELAVIRAAVVTCAVSMLFIDSFSSPVVALPFWACLGVLLAPGGRDVGPPRPAGPSGKELPSWPPWPTARPRSLAASGSPSAPTGARLPGSSTSRESVPRAGR
jgi:O-Antigen ligase